MNAGTHGVSPIHDHLRSHLKTLEEMFSDPELSRLRASSTAHPAVLQYDEVARYLANDVYYPDDIDAARSVAASLLDRTIWIAPSAADYWSIIPDPAARAKIKQRIVKPEQYHDTLAEVHYWSWLQSSGAKAELYEINSYPDIRASFSSGVDSWIEVKRIRLGTSPNRIRKDVKDANKQLATADANHAGLMVISLDRAVTRLSLDDAVPNDVEEYIAEARRELGSGHSSNVAKVLFVWDEFMADAVVGSILAYRFRRRSLILDHSSPVSILQLDPAELFIDRSISFSSPWPGVRATDGRRSTPRHGNLIVSPQFREFNANTDGIRPQHAIEAVLRPDAEYRHQLAGGDWESFVTRRVTQAREPYTMLTLVRELNDGRREIGEAYRIYDDGDANLSGDPLAAFYVFIQRYGAPVGLKFDPSSEPTWCLLAMYAVVPTASTEGLSLDIAFPADGRDYLSGAASITPQAGLQEAIVELLYLVDVQRYRQAVTRRRR